MNRSDDRILIIARDSSLRARLGRILKASQFDFGEVPNEESALPQLKTAAYQAILLDLSAPRGSGVAICRQLRYSFPRLPVLVMSNSRSLNTMVSMLDAGADDYLTRPFGERELVARLCSLLRRFRTPRLAPARQLTVGSVMLDWSRHRVEQARREISLTPTEFLTLQILMQNAGVPVTNEVLLSAIWGEKHTRHQENLRMIISALRKKLGDDLSDPVYLLTHKALGYSFRVPERIAV
jgi:two-component system KDP operon response regulator KdpE